MELGFTKAEISALPKREIDGWILAREVAALEADGGSYDYETGEVTPPPPPRERELP